ncbi:MAG: hypothetical protein IPG71_10005 [bacterium]|nr:hypothetical protein [bacterium]
MTLRHDSGPTTSLSYAGSSDRRSVGRVLLLSARGGYDRSAVERLRLLGIDVHITTSSLAALGLIVDVDPEILWIDSTDDELTVGEILDAIKTPRQVRPISVVVSLDVSCTEPELELADGDEVLDLGASAANPSQLQHLIKVTRLERLVIRRENEILDSLPNALLVVDRQMTLWKVNRQVSELLEITDPDFRRKALGRPLAAGLTAAGLALDGDSPLPRLLRELERCVKSNGTRFRVKETIGDAEKLLSGIITPLEHSPELVLIDLRDISADERAVLVEARRERLATIGNLSVGVAHEIQNPNTFSRVNAANLKMMFEAVKPVLAHAAIASGGTLGNMSAETFVAKAQEAIAAVDMASRRIDAVLTTLKSFGRQDDGKLESVAIKPVVDESVMLVRHEARGKAEIHVVLPDSLPPVIASATGLSQVLVNLLQNSIHALEQKFETGSMGSAPAIHVVCEAVNEDEVILSVSDNGPGIPENLLDKIFRPYFTTKPQGQGTGLGLSISTDMMHRFGGDLTLRSRPGEGVTFYLKLRRQTESPVNE